MPIDQADTTGNGRPAATASKLSELVTSTMPCRRSSILYSLRANVHESQQFDSGIYRPTSSVASKLMNSTTFALSNPHGCCHHLPVVQEHLHNRIRPHYPPRIWQLLLWSQPPEDKGNRAALRPQQCYHPPHDHYAQYDNVQTIATSRSFNGSGY